jgi:hypothetical protein
MRRPDSKPPPPKASARKQFWTRYSWLILRNVLGWTLILISFLVGPLVPGPGGIPLFLIGFALVSLPGKRRLTARVLRGKPIRHRTKWFSRISLAIAIAASVAALSATRPWNHWPMARPLELLVASAAYVLGIAAAWLVIRLTLVLTNVLLLFSPRARRRIRPWLRHHHIRLLPPRRRQRLPHEHGRGPHKLNDEILKLGRRP